MNSDLEKLWELQTVLSKLGDCEREMSVKPDSFAAVDAEYQSADEEMTRLAQTLETVSREQRRVEGELADQQDLLKKYQGQLMQVKNQQQYAAAWKEIDASRKHVKDLEDSAMKSMSESATIQGQLDERSGAHDELKSRWDAAHAQWQHSLGDLRKEAEELRKRAGKIEATISPRLRDEFHRVFKQRQGVAVAAVLSDSCSSCRTRIRPALYQQLKRGELSRCEGCHRILYMENPSS